jgi:hypothetical protein
MAQHMYHSRLSVRLLRPWRCAVSEHRAFEHMDGGPSTKAGKTLMAGMHRTLAAFTSIVALLGAETRPVAQTPDDGLLQLEAKISLGHVSGRIDHLAIDQSRRRVFVAELGNNSVGIVDLDERRLIHTIHGLKEPQGVAFVPSTGMLYVANAGDGSLRLFSTPDYAPAGQLELGDDADNIRWDSATNRLFVGYGSGGLAVIDPSTFKRIADIPLGSHPESFQLDPNSDRIFVNLPKAQAIGVVDRHSVRPSATWSMGNAGGNFPMALDPTTGHVLVAFRAPAKLGVFSAKDGASISHADICGDADDVFVDAKRRRVYISCGEGLLDALDAQGNAFKRIARIPTVPGARTSVFVPELDRLLLAVPAVSGEPAAIWVFHPLH